MMTQNQPSVWLNNGKTSQWPRQQLKTVMDCYSKDLFQDRSGYTILETGNCLKSIVLLSVLSTSSFHVRSLMFTQVL